MSEKKEEVVILSKDQLPLGLSRVYHMAMNALKKKQLGKGVTEADVIKTVFHEGDHALKLYEIAERKKLKDKKSTIGFAKIGGKIEGLYFRPSSRRLSRKDHRDIAGAVDEASDGDLLQNVKYSEWELPPNKKKK